MNLKTNQAFAALVASRVFLVLIINTIPDMDPSYLRIATAIFETSERTSINLPFGYGALLYPFVKIFGFALATKLIYLTFSIATGAVLYRWVKAMFDERAAVLAILLFTLVPNFTFALVGFSHTVAVAMFFLIVALYFYWRMLNGVTNLSSAVVAGGAALCGTLIRPELALYFLAFVAAQIVLLAFRRRAIGTKRAIVSLAAAVAIFAGGLTGNYSLNLARSGSAHPTIFTDGEHSYLTYMHTLSLRAGKGVDDGVAAELGAQTFGDAEANKQSIPRAVANNPKEAAKNIVFNVKDLLDNLGHQLFMPFFLFFLVGIGLFVADWRALWRQQLFLLACLIPCVAALVLFHIEVRYLNPIAIVFTIWAAVGLNLVHPKISKAVLITVFAGLVLLFATQAAYFSQNPVGQLKI